MTPRNLKENGEQRHALLRVLYDVHFLSVGDDSFVFKKSDMRECLDYNMLSEICKYCPVLLSIYSEKFVSLQCYFDA